MISETIKKLRNKETVKFLNKEDKMIYGYQLNKREKTICWERYRMKPGARHSGRWVCLNRYMTLKEVVKDITKISNNNKKHN